MAKTRTHVTKQDDETQTEFAIRTVVAEAYQVAHDEYCPFGEGSHPAVHPDNPYLDPAKETEA